MASILEAIIAINSSAQASVDDEDYSKITWLNDTTPISEADIKAKQAELETAFTNNAYQRNRAAEYPSIKDQLDDIYHNGIDAWKATIKVTKDKYPKG
tara:strand:+ start:51 stop:344 length:294 start_codon:yes stop_codon:yes gene_type:complete